MAKVEKFKEVYEGFSGVEELGESRSSPGLRMEQLERASGTSSGTSLRFLGEHLERAAGQPNLPLRLAQSKRAVAKLPLKETDVKDKPQRYKLGRQDARPLASESRFRKKDLDERPWPRGDEEERLTVCVLPEEQMETFVRKGKTPTCTGARLPVGDIVAVARVEDIQQVGTFGKVVSPVAGWILLKDTGGKVRQAWPLDEPPSQAHEAKDHWPFRPNVPVRGSSHLAKAAVALYKPLAWFVGMLPAYADGVMKQLVDGKQQDKDPNFNLFTGRFLARIPDAKFWLEEYFEHSPRHLDNVKPGTVVNIAQVMAKSNYNRDFTFWRDAAISVSNLFVRAVEDVQAMFRTGFAGDPEWNGECLSALSVFEKWSVGKLVLLLDDRKDGWAAGEGWHKGDPRDEKGSLLRAWHLEGEPRDPDVHPRLWCLLAHSEPPEESEDGARIESWALEGLVAGFRNARRALDLSVVQSCSDVEEEVSDLDPKRDVIYWEQSGAGKAWQEDRWVVSRTAQMYQRKKGKSARGTLHMYSNKWSGHVPRDGGATCLTVTVRLTANKLSSRPQSTGFWTANSLFGPTILSQVCQKLHNTRNEVHSLGFIDTSTFRCDIKPLTMAEAKNILVKSEEDLRSIGDGLRAKLAPIRVDKLNIQPEVKEELEQLLLHLEPKIEVSRKSCDYKQLPITFAKRMEYKVVRTQMASRPECEHARLSTAFLRLFPTFAAVAFRYKLAFEKILREINLCLGHGHSSGLLNSRKVFRGPAGEDFSPDTLPRGECIGDQGQFGFVKQRSKRALRLLRKFLLLLGAKDFRASQRQQQQRHTDFDVEELRLLGATKWTFAPLRHLMATDFNEALGIEVNNPTRKTCGLWNQDITFDRPTLTQDAPRVEDRDGVIDAHNDGCSLQKHDFKLRGRLWRHVALLPPLVQKIATLTYGAFQEGGVTTFSEMIGVPLKCTQTIAVIVMTGTNDLCTENTAGVTITPVSRSLTATTWSSKVLSAWCYSGRIHVGRTAITISHCTDSQTYWDWKVLHSVELEVGAAFADLPNSNMLTGLPKLGPGMFSLLAFDGTALAGGIPELVEGSILGLDSAALIPADSLEAAGATAMTDIGFRDIVLAAKKVMDGKPMSKAVTTPFKIEARAKLHVSLETTHTTLKFQKDGRDLTEFRKATEAHAFVNLGGHVKVSVPGAAAFTTAVYLQRDWDFTRFVENYWNELRWKEHVKRIESCKACLLKRRYFCDWWPVIYSIYPNHNREFSEDGTTRCEQQEGACAVLPGDFDAGAAAPDPAIFKDNLTTCAELQFFEHTS